MEESDLNEDSTCICKHSKWKHTMEYSYTSDGCSGIYDYTKEGIEWCQCMHFKRDNLEYLEWLNEKKEKENA